jgi:hypothetical protein
METCLYQACIWKVYVKNNYIYMHVCDVCSMHRNKLLMIETSMFQAWQVDIKTTYMHVYM